MHCLRLIFFSPFSFFLVIATTFYYRCFFLENKEEKKKWRGERKPKPLLFFLFLVGLWVSVCIKDSCTHLLR